MKKLIKELLLPPSKTSIFLILGLLFVLIVNFTGGHEKILFGKRKHEEQKTLLSELMRIRMFQSIIPQQEVGFEFLGLDQFLSGVTYIGYYTDDDINDEFPGRLFAQAQLTLAPVILHYNSADYEYILFVFKNKDSAFQKIEEIGAEPFKINQYGVILARKK